MKLSKELLKEIYEYVDENLKAKIENEVPKIKPTLETNRWITEKNHNTWIIYVKEDNTAYGISAYGNWFNSDVKKFKDCLENTNNRYATPEEVETALIAEAKRKYNGKKIKCNHILDISVNFNDYTKIELNADNCLRLYTDRNCICIMGYNGTWATIITEPTEKELLIEKLNELK